MKTAAALALFLLSPSLCAAFEHHRGNIIPNGHGGYYCGCRSCRGITGHRYDYRIDFDYPWRMDPLPLTRPCHACNSGLWQGATSGRRAGDHTLYRSRAEEPHLEAQPELVVKPPRLRNITRANATSSTADQ